MTTTYQPYPGDGYPAGSVVLTAGDESAMSRIDRTTLQLLTAKPQPNKKQSPVAEAYGFAPRELRELRGLMIEKTELIRRYQNECLTLLELYNNLGTAYLSI